MAILIDEPRWPAHGRLWAHLVSDSDLEELHRFADANDIPRRGFDRDHYDVPDEAHLLLEEVARRVNGPLTVILERDGAFPAIDSLVAELDRIRATLQRGRQRRRPDRLA